MVISFLVSIIINTSFLHVMEQWHGGLKFSRVGSVKFGAPKSYPILLVSPNISRCVLSQGHKEQGCGND